MKNKSILLLISLIVISVSSFSGLIIFAHGLTISPSVDQEGRREYGYCPISPENMLSRAQFEINGCPLIRVYVTNWNQLSTPDQQTLDTQLRSAGFKDISELDSRVK